MVTQEIANIFPDSTVDQEDALLSRMATWDMVAGFPVPRFPFFCGCGRAEVKLLSYNFLVSDKKENTDSLHRCCINMQCFDCSALHDFRVVLTKDEFDRMSDGLTARLYRWREVKRLIKVPA